MQHAALLLAWVLRELKMVSCVEDEDIRLLCVTPACLACNLPAV